MKKEFKQELLEYIKDAATTSKEVEQLLGTFIEIQQLKSINNMHINVSVSRNYRDDVKYYAARTFFPIGIDEEKEFRVYVGKVDSFKNGPDDERLLEIAKKKLLALIHNYRESVRKKERWELIGEMLMDE